MTGNDVTYTYGTTGTGRGRITKIEDGAGMQEMAYDALGNVTDETRTIALPQHSEVYRFRMLYEYDSWGRMLSMTYPDNEKITYTYQWGGDLCSMTGRKNGAVNRYVRSITYNDFGQRSSIVYGNLTRTEYAYDSLHRLTHLRSFSTAGTMQDIDYTFDNASNVTRIVNNAGGVNTLGGTYGNTYKYDALHRLVESYGGGDIGSYNTYLTYSPSGRLMRKDRDNSSVTLSASVEMAYGYCDDYQPHAVKRMFDYKNGMLYDLRWDEAGNLGQVSMARPDEMFEGGRFLYWTEDSRMHAAVDDRYYSYYAYDHGGERRLKLTGDNKSLDVNADFMSSYTILTEPTLYPSAYMVLTNKGYTKHYYAGTERVAARLGGGGLNALCRAVGSDEGLQTKADLLFGQSFDQVNSRVLQENNLHCIMGNEFATEVFGHPIDGIPNQMKAGTDLNHDLFKYMVHSMLDDSQNGEENEVYFYHSDHLGSASWITDVSGVAVQHIQYLPYGEPYVNQHPFGYSERFTFTGKERDEETGYGYFAARYMDHELLSSFISVDRYADKYPFISPYVYCAWNSMRFIDPSGDTINVSRLSSTALGKYNANIQELQKSPLFSSDYNVLQNSTKTYYIEEGAGKGGGGSFEPNRSTISASLDNLYAISQELFHAFQSDCNIYSNNDASVRETEGDLAAQLVMYDLGRVCPAGDWSLQLLYYVGNNGYTGILTPQFSKDFSNMVDLRIIFYKQRALQDGAQAPPSYIQANSGKPPLALQRAISKSLQQH